MYQELTFIIAGLHKSPPFFTVPSESEAQVSVHSLSLVFTVDMTTVHYSSIIHEESEARRDFCDKPNNTQE